MYLFIKHVFKLTFTYDWCKKVLNKLKTKKKDQKTSQGWARVS